MIDIEVLKQRHKEELEDVETYANLAKKCPEYGSILNDISHEEKTHAKLLNYIIEHITN